MEGGVVVVLVVLWRLFFGVRVLPAALHLLRSAAQVYEKHKAQCDALL